MDRPVCSPSRETFQRWLTLSFLSNNRTKTITSEKYDKICRYMLGDNRSTNAKFRYWVRTKGFFLARSYHSDFGHSYQGHELMIRRHPEGQSGGRVKRLQKFEAQATDGIDVRKVAAVEDFYDIIKAIHVDKRGSHAGQKRTYKIISCIYSFLPREVVTFYLVNCEACKPRVIKFGNGSHVFKPSLDFKFGRKCPLDALGTEETIANLDKSDDESITEYEVRSSI